MSDAESNGFTSFINDPDQSPYQVPRDYALKNPNWTEKQDKVGKDTVLALLNRGLDVTTTKALLFIASRVNMEAERRNLAAIEAGNNPAVGDLIKRSDNGVKCKLGEWLQELYKKGRITEAAKDTAIDGLQLQCIQLQGQLATANNLKEELQGQVATLEEQLTTAHGENEELAKALSASEEAKRDMEAALKKSQAATEQTAACLKKRKRENDNNVDISQ